MTYRDEIHAKFLKERNKNFFDDFEEYSIWLEQQLIESTNKNCAKLPVKNLLPDREQLIDKAYLNVPKPDKYGTDARITAMYENKVMHAALDIIYKNVEGNCS